MKITFNLPYATGQETHYINDAVCSGKISGNGKYTRLCQHFFEKKYGFKKCLLTTSCTDALEMSAILLNIKNGDEVIMPSYTFVSTANAFILRGSKVIFADSKSDHPCVDVNSIKPLITARTKAIVVVHYAGIACEMDEIMELANKHDLYVIEDAAQAIDSFYIDKNGVKKALGSIGHLATFSFHESKNIICGEGGMLVINDKQFEKRAEIIWEKGTNRADFFRGDVDQYNWMDIGSSFLPSEISAAFLWAQLENIDTIQNKRKLHWEYYAKHLKNWAEKHNIKLSPIPNYATNNAHMFYLICNNNKQRNKLIQYLYERGILSVFHYLSLHKSPFFKNQHDGRNLPYSDLYTDCLIRLPLYYQLSKQELNFVCNSIISFEE
jgi:dTDP-4-amino-4,6-dideoxygalactose transaminase